MQSGGDSYALHALLLFPIQELSRASNIKLSLSEKKMPNPETPVTSKLSHVPVSACRCVQLQLCSLTRGT